MVQVTFSCESSDQLRAELMAMALIMSGTAGYVHPKANATEPIASPEVVKEQLELIAQNNIEATQSVANPEVKTKRTRRTKAEVEAEKSTLGKDVEDQTEVSKQAAAAQDDAGEMTLREKVHQALQLVNAELGIEGAIKLLGQFGVKRQSELPEGKFQDFIDACYNTIDMAD